MPSRTWMPFYPADYLAHTQHLTVAQHGAYVLLIFHYWTTGGLPDDDRQLATIAKMTVADWRKNRPVLAAFFDAGWKHKRVEQEIARAEDKYKKRVEAGRVGGEKSGEQRRKLSKTEANASANAQAEANQPESHSSSGKKTEPVSPELQAAFDEFFATMPKRKGGGSYEEARQAYIVAVAEGADPQHINSAARQYASEMQTTADKTYIKGIVGWLRDQYFRSYDGSPAPVTVLGKPKHLERRLIGGQVQVWLGYDSHQFRAWNESRQRLEGRPYPVSDCGWYFDSEWPPDHPERAAQFFPAAA